MQPVIGWVNFVSTECSEDDKFRCQNGLCLDLARMCNNVDDCGDRSDEDDCEGKAVNHPKT